MAVLLVALTAGASTPSHASSPAPPSPAASMPVTLPSAAPPATPPPTPTTPAAAATREALDAEASVAQLAVYPGPGAPRPTMFLPNPWPLDGDRHTPIPQVLLATQQRPDGWVQVLLPVRPNGTLGWVHAGDVRLTANPYRIQVSLSGHAISVTRGTTQLYQGPVAVGAPSTPTPPGRYYTRVLLQTTGRASVYGPYAYGLSAHSQALNTFDGSDAEIGLHGNDNASVLGTSVSHGCVRMDNAEIARLAAVLPLGTPVDIVP